MKVVAAIKKLALFLTIFMVIGLSGCSTADSPEPAGEPGPLIGGLGDEESLTLPPITGEEGSLKDLIYQRVSRRDFSDKALELDQAAILLWSAGGINIDGVTGPTRAIPSAGATYPLDFYLVAGNVTGLEPGVYSYDYVNHLLVAVSEGDKLELLANAALNQNFIADAPAAIVMVAFYERTTERYGERGGRYVHMDAGYASQNVYLMAVEMGLITVAIGAFNDGEVAEILSTGGEPLLIMPVGLPAGD